jgi:hypothetical protein
MAWFTVHVSPGVANVVGEPGPLVHEDKLLTLPGPAVTHAVARAADMLHNNRAQQRNACIGSTKERNMAGMFCG